MIAVLAFALAQGDLAREVYDKGSIVYGARSPKGDWDLFVMRPDGSDVRNLTQTPEFNEALPRYSPDGRRLLYRRLPKTETFDNNRHGLQGELVIANADGTNPHILGAPGDYPWASWSPDGKKIACLSTKGIVIVDLETRKVTGTLERRGFFQQMTWSADGKWLSGVANNFDTGWSVARMEMATGAVNAVSKVDCCTPDWFPDSKFMVFSRRPGEWTQLWMADAEGRQRSPLYSEEGRHCYGGCVSPDGKYVLFTGNKEEDGDPRNGGAPMALMRLRDAPIVKHLSKPASGQVLSLPVGWEPHWTQSKTGGGK
jgi:Tol biopolymer transport system component